MPMPTGGAWPPPAHAPAYEAYRDWDAWYTGSPDRLREVYQGRGARGGQTLPPSQRAYPGQYAGGVFGRLSRWLWGNPTPLTMRDTRLHVPVPADLATVGANLLFSEPPRLIAQDPRVMQRLEQLVDDGLNRTLMHAREVCSVLGDVYLRPVIDQDVLPGKAFVGVHHADAAVPTIRWGRLLEVTFWSELERDNQRVVRLLEHHDVDRTVPDAPAGRITYAVFDGNTQDLGKRVDLRAYDATKHLVDQDLVDAAGVQLTGLDRLDVIRIPNRGPQRLWRADTALKYLGRSDFDGNEQVFDQIDEVWTSWMRDIRLAKGRITVPEYMLQANGPGQGASWDPEREVYSTVTALPTAGAGITVSQFAIRVVEHKATIDSLMEVATRHAGYSTQTMGEEGDTPVTATEIQARERLSFTTRSTDVQVWGPALAEYLDLHLALEAVAFSGPAPVRPDVEFGDSVTESPETVARTLQLLEAALAVSTETKVRMLHPDWDDTRVQAEVAEIKGASGALVEDPGSFTGGPPAESAPDAQGAEAAPEEEPPPPEV